MSRLLQRIRSLEMVSGYPHDLELAGLTSITKDCSEQGFLAIWGRLQYLVWHAGIDEKETSV